MNILSHTTAVIDGQEVNLINPEGNRFKIQYGYGGSCGRDEWFDYGADGGGNKAKLFKCFDFALSTTFVGLDNSYQYYARIVDYDTEEQVGDIIQLNLSRDYLAVEKELASQGQEPYAENWNWLQEHGFVPEDMQCKLSLN